ncbi:MAG TPA: ABC transporter permease [Mycobacteriales bacterium]|nr:ABC transporter permease [Mycobacteriales bacterium]
MANHSIPHQIKVWFSTKSSYTGNQGAIHLLWQHVEISGLSILAAAVVAIPLGIGLARWRRGGVVVTSIANTARAIPILGILILLAVGPLGVGMSAAVAALAIFAVPPMLTNTFTGIQEVDQDTRRAAVGMGMTRWQVTRRVEVPLAIPLIATGVRLATVQVWATATLAAIVGSGGLGQLVVTGREIQNYGELYGGVVIIVITALLIEGGMALVQRALRRRFGDAGSERASSVPIASVESVTTAS